MPMISLDNYAFFTLCLHQTLLTNALFKIVYCMYNLGVGGDVVKVVILILGVISEVLLGS